MRILVVMDPVERVNIDKDTTFGFLLAAQARGHEVFYCNQRHLFADGGDGWAWAAPLTVRYDQADFFTLGAWADHRLADFDTIWMRKDPPVDRAYLHASHLLDLSGDALVVNDPDGVRFANEEVKQWFVMIKDREGRFPRRQGHLRYPRQGCSRRRRAHRSRRRRARSDRRR